MSESFFHDTNAVVEKIIVSALERTASDIHLESHKNKVRVRFRIDGLLYDQESIDQVPASQLIACIKVLANIDVAQKRIAQDGKFRFPGDSSIDLRVATFPAIYGEKVVIRVLHQTDTVVSLERIGMLQNLLITFRELLAKPSGFLLVSGPTGAGKTTTLYAALTELNSTEKHIITLEDPVEYCLSGVTQGQVHAAIGFDFTDGMRALLRQDPDIVLIGEMRDFKTAQTAIQAALTGHMVLSTVHTNDAPSVIIRLMDMGIEPFLINAALSGVVAQRLVRMLCTECKQEKKPNDQEREVLNRLHAQIDTLFIARGCATCFGMGHQGRIGIFEFLIMSETLQQFIIQRPALKQLRAQALADGMQRMHDDGLQKVASGVISLQELFRVLN